MSETIYDAAVIGCGCVGAYAAFYLSKYDLKIAMIEAGSEPAFGATKANSGIVHASHNTDEGTLKYTMVDEGNRRIRELSRQLNFGYTQCGEVVVAKNESQLPALQQMFYKALRAGLKAYMLTKEQLHEREPNVVGEAAIFVPEAGVVNPYEMTIAVYNSAHKSGCDGFFNHKVQSVRRENDIFVIACQNGREIKTRFVVNAAGVYSDAVAKMVDPEASINIRPRKGEEYLLDKDCAGLVNSIIFPLPDGKSKGILVIPTVDKTIMVGPTAVDVDDKEDKATSAEGMKKVFETAGAMVKGLNYNMVIASFTGVRAVEAAGDFIVECRDGFINLAGIQSPGMTSSPVLGEKAAHFVVETLKPRANDRFSLSPLSQRFALGNKKQLVEQDGNHSKILCGCELVTVADVYNAITDGARTVDGVKARTRAGMGRCQGGFCTTGIVDILSSRLQIPRERICKNDPGTELSLNEIGGAPAEAQDIEEILPYTPSAVDAADLNLLSADKDRFKRLFNAENATIDVLIIGGGPSGLAAGQAAAAALSPDRLVLVLEKNDRTGGVLVQCIHAGFGLKRFSAELTGPECAELMTRDAVRAGCDVLLNAFVVSIAADQDGYAVSAVIYGVGFKQLKCKQLIAANGCRERSRQNIRIAGTRPSGVFTAGMAQTMINISGQLPGKRVLILGSGDIGLIMARRCTLEGAHVVGVYELLPRCSGLQRNVAQCLDDFGIPLHLSQTVVTIIGRDRVQAVEIAPVDAVTLVPDLTKKYTVECDCLLLSVGLIPQVKIAVQAQAKISAQSRLLEVDSSRRVSENAFAAGNCLYVHDLADDAAIEGELAGRAAAEAVLGNRRDLGRKFSVSKDENVLFCVPDFVYDVPKQDVSLRVKKPLGRAVVRAYCGATLVGCTEVEDAVPAEMIHVELGTVTGDVRLQVEPVASAPQATESAGEKQLTCIVCPRGCRMRVRTNSAGDIEEITGNACPRGREYAEQEHREPFRVFSTTVRLENGVLERLPVKIAKPIPKSKLVDAARAIKQLRVVAPVELGRSVGKVCGVDVLACCSVAAAK